MQRVGLMKNWPVWIPYPGSWLSALFLLLLGSGLTYAAAWLLHLGTALGQISPRLATLVWFLAMLSPIALIAIAHHFLHLLLDRFFPDTQLLEVGKTEGPLPSLMSWWEGLYGWLILVLAPLITMGILGTFFFSSTSFASELHKALKILTEIFSSWDNARHILRLPTLLWIAIAAYLYQFQHLAHQRLMALGRANRQEK